MNENFKYIRLLESGGAEPLPTEGSTLRYTVWAIVATTATIGATQYGILGALVAAPLMLLDSWAIGIIEREAQNELLAFYAAVKEPLFEWQQSPTDAEVFSRATRHRQLLAESGNSLYLKGKIEVVEVYFKDPTFDYCETFEEFEARRSDMKKDYLRDWAKRITKNDDAWRKQFLHGQVGIRID